MQELETLRLYVRNVLKNIKRQQKEQLRNEMNEHRSLRKTIRKLIREKQDTPIHDSTGMNVLEDTMDLILKNLSLGYKSLTTSKDQRDSFKAHIVRATQNLLANADIYNQSEEAKKQPTSSVLATPQTEELKEEDTEQTADSGAKVNAAPPAVNPAAQVSEPPEPFEKIEGEDDSGARKAEKVFNNIKKNILTNYNLLSDPKDIEVFSKFLITNLLMRFDQFEDELSKKPNYPTTPEYEAAKAKKDAQTMGAAATTTAEVNPAVAGTAPQAAAEPAPAPAQQEK